MEIFSISYIEVDPLNTQRLRDRKDGQDPAGCIVNTLGPSNTYIHQGIMPTLVKITARRLVGAKPSSEPVLEYC